MSKEIPTQEELLERLSSAERAELESSTISDARRYELINKMTDGAYGENQANNAIQETVNVIGSMLNTTNTIVAEQDRANRFSANYRLSAVINDSAPASTHPFAFRINKTFTSYLDQLQSMVEETKEHGSRSTKLGDFSDLLSLEATNPMAMRPATSDTSVGGNAAINCRYAWCRNDDIIHPLQALNGNPALGGLGRVYNELYDIPQQLVHMTAGVAEFQAIASFYSNAVDGDMLKDVNNGESINIMHLLGQGTSLVAKGVLLLAFPIPIMAYKFISWLADKIDPNTKVTRYYELKGAMPMYYRLANSMLVHVAVNLGFYPNSALIPDSWNEKAGNSQTQGTQMNANLQKVLAECLGNIGSVPSRDALPEWLRQGPSIYNIITKRDWRINPEAYTEDSDTYLNPEKNDNLLGLFNIWKPKATASACGADKFVSFRINKSTDSSESISNSTGQSSIAQFFNNRAQQGRDAMFTFAGGKIADIWGISAAAQGLTDFAQGVSSQFGMTSLATAILTGSGFLDIPDIWLSSSFTKSYSFSMDLRTPYGDNLSILQMYIPMFLLLPFACPRSVGANSYTSPFLLRAYCKGMFAVPLGIIDSFNLTRGASEYGWNVGRLPTTIKITFTIKDLAPILHLALADGASITNIFGNNTPFQEYMQTLSGFGLNERLLWFSNVVRRMHILSCTKKSTLFSLAYWAVQFGNSTIGRILGGLSPWSLFGNR